MENAAKVALGSLLMVVKCQFEGSGPGLGSGSGPGLGQSVPKPGGIRDIYRTSCAFAADAILASASQAYRTIQKTAAPEGLFSEEAATASGGMQLDELQGGQGLVKARRYEEAVEGLSELARALQTPTKDKLLEQVQWVGIAQTRQQQQQQQQQQQRDTMEGSVAGSGGGVDQSIGVDQMESVHVHAKIAAALQGALYTSVDAEKVVEGMSCLRQSAQLMRLIDIHDDNTVTTSGKPIAIVEAEADVQVTHPLNTPHGHIASKHPLNNCYQPILASHPLTLPSQTPLSYPTPSTHPLNLPSHSTLPTSPILPHQMVSSLGACAEYLQMIEQAHTVTAEIVCRVLSSYLDVVSGTADVLLNPLQQGAAAHGWLVKGVQLADLIADEDPSLQLYRLIRAEDLATLLHRINGCATQMMEIYPTFTVQELR